jgi:hypothetical protein
MSHFKIISAILTGWLELGIISTVILHFIVGHVRLVDWNLKKITLSILSGPTILLITMSVKYGWFQGPFSFSRIGKLLLGIFLLAVPAMLLVLTMYHSSMALIPFMVTGPFIYAGFRLIVYGYIVSD